MDGEALALGGPEEWEPVLGGEAVEVIYPQVRLLVCVWVTNGPVMKVPIGLN